MNALAIKIVDRITKLTGGAYEKDDLEVYYYGMICFLNMFAITSVIAVWAIITNCFFETFAFLALFALIRHHGGGYHAHSNEQCTIFSSLLGISVKFILPYGVFLVTHKLLILVGAATICLLLAPIDSKKVDLTDRQKLREKIITLGIILLAALFSDYIPVNYAGSLLYSVISSTFLMVIAKVKQIGFQHHLHII